MSKRKEGNKKERMRSKVTDVDRQVVIRQAQICLNVNVLRMRRGGITAMNVCQYVHRRDGRLREWQEYWSRLKIYYGKQRADTVDKPRKSGQYLRTSRRQKPKSLLCHLQRKLEVKISEIRKPIRVSQCHNKPSFVTSMRMYASNS